MDSRETITSGQAQNRTGDTKIFSLLLYLLSYLATLTGQVICRKQPLLSSLFRFLSGNFLFFSSSIPPDALLPGQIIPPAGAVKKWISLGCPLNDPGCPGARMTLTKILLLQNSGHIVAVSG